MAIYRLPPSPFTGGRQPLAPKDLIPQEGPLAEPFVPGKIQLVSTWIGWIETPVIQQPRVFTPQVAEAAGDFVPSRSITNIIRGWWQQPVLEYLHPKIVIAGYIHQDPLPYKGSRLEPVQIWWSEQDYQIQIPFSVPFTETEADEIVLQGRPQLQIILEELPLPRLQNKIASLIFVPAVVNDPPFSSRDFRVINIWNIPPDPTYIKYNEIVESAPSDDPPFDGRRLRMPTILEAWRPPPPEPWNPILHFTPPPSGDIIIWMWKRIL